MKKHNLFSLNGTQATAWMLLLVFVSSILYPSVALAGGGGPSQPEVQGFTPIGVSDMVDPFTGDFTYNIPLMDVEGYPINIAYNSGVSMDQEASWVGLGWNLNMGAVVRSMRGLPDDFNGDQVVKTVSQKPSVNMGLDFGANFELAGFNFSKKENDTSGGGLNIGLGVNYNNYMGISSDFSIGPSFKFGKSQGQSGTAGFTLSGSSENGASFAPSLSLDAKHKSSQMKEFSVKNTIGAGMNSRAGLQSISYTRSYQKEHQRYKKDANGNKIEDKKVYANGAFNTSFDLGLHSYSPTAGPSMFGFSTAGTFNIGADVVFNDVSFKIGFNYSRQWIPDNWKTITSPAYGYFNLDQIPNSKKEKALMDFNRDNDGTFTKYSRFLPSAQLMYDVYSIQAQGVSGSFRGFRNDVGYVSDPTVQSHNVSGNAGFEFGMGQLTDVGADIAINYTNSKSGVWDNRNEALAHLGYHPSTPGDLVGAYSMRDASEGSVDNDALMATQFYEGKPAYFPLGGGFPGFTKLKGKVALSANTTTDLTQNKRSSRITTNTQLSFLTNEDLAKGLGLNALHPNIYANYKGHHIGEITQLGQDGRRYVFGIAAYNHFQEDATFAIGKTMSGDLAPVANNLHNGITNYGTNDNGNELASTSNDYGIDNYYSSTTTPQYAHSHLLTAVLSDDYVDADAVKGPSDDDLGSYVKFNYEKVENHKWRTPVEENTAYYNEGLKTDLTDDKASFVYGEKDLWYVKAVETKNYIAVFVLQDRADGKSAKGRNGGTELTNVNAMKRLHKIVLYTKPEYNAHIADLSQATPIQEVEFVHKYSLCKNYPGNLNPAGDNGKLTLTEIRFSYQGSKKMHTRSYKFDYSSVNPNYNLKAQDRWGVYKPVSSGSNSPLGPNITNADYPYTIQDPTLTNSYATAWCLTDIKLPSGGKIKVDYESDDYAYVQHKKAAQMFNIVAIGDGPNSYTATLDGQPSFENVSDNSGTYEKNKDLIIRLKDPDDSIQEYATKGQQLYFRVLMDFHESINDTVSSKCEYVSGYGTITNLQNFLVGGVRYGRISLQGEKLMDAGGADYSPITKAAIQMGRMHMSRYINDLASSNEPDGSEQGFLDFANSLVSAFASFGELFTGPNLPIYKKDRGVNLVVNKSWVRLTEPSGKKLGGGTRVSQIRIYDQWGEMTSGNAADSYTYGQKFDYVLEDGRSSGVAAYEPQIGGDENPWHTAYVVNQKKLFAMDDQLYLEDPIMESQFPSPTVGYSRVVISDLPHANVSRTATGKVVKEFYTAKDFPTIVKATNLDMSTANSFLPILPKYQYLNASQGFTIELNDMHGKPRKESVYGQNQTAPLSTVDYYYQSSDLFLNGEPNKRLENKVLVIDPNGDQQEREIGVKYDVVADFRESQTRSVGGKLEINTNSVLFGVFPVVLPTFWPSLDMTENRFRSATLSKTIQRFGILEKTVANQDGSIVETKTLAYDEQTGQGLVSETTTNFNDKVYSLNFPAYWNYDLMGSAGDNLNYSIVINGTNNAGFAPVASGQNHLVPGDEVAVKSLAISPPYTTFKAWVKESTAQGIVLIDKQGNAVSISGASLIQIIRSGRKNKQATSMASVTTLENPIPAIKSNQYKKVLNAGAVEFSQEWDTYCNCFKSPATATTNPYVLGTLGNFRPVRSFTHLSGRTQSDYDNNTNIRRDGVFTSYNPYYKNVNGNWQVDGSNWTFVSQVTAFSPNGMTLETRDALGRYSASNFGYNNTLTTAVAANTQIKELAFGSFEDVAYSNCMDQNFFNKVVVGSNAQSEIPATMLSTSEAHTGRNSIKVESGQPVVFKNVVSNCVETTCNLEMKYNDKINGFDVVNGTAPYQLDVNLVSGSGNVDLNPNGTLSLTYVATQYLEMIITLTDANGCSATFKVTRAAPTKAQQFPPIIINKIK